MTPEELVRYHGLWSRDLYTIEVEVSPDGLPHAIFERPYEPLQESQKLRSKR